MKTYKDLFVALQHLPDDQHISEWFMNDRWKGKDKQESVFRLTARLGLIEKLQDFRMCNGNFNRRTIRPMSSYRDIFYDTKNNDVCLKDKGDSSDLTGIHKSDPHHLVVSTSKCINRLSLHNLDIDTIIMNFQQYSGYQMTLCIIVQDCEQFHGALKRSEKTSQYLRHIIEKHQTIILDWDDLNQAYRRFRDIYDGKTVDELIDKKPLLLRPHQRLCCRKTMQLKDQMIPKILWGHIQRSGKSYMMTGVIIEDSLEKSNCNYLVMTTAPKETIEQYVQVFDCVQLADFRIIHIDGKNRDHVVLGNKNIILCSKQFLQNKLVRKIGWLSDMQFDLRFLDESHHGGTTQLAKKVLSTYGADACTVYITATYSKPVNDYAIPREHWILWDLEDIQFCKKGDMQSLIRKHGNDISELFGDDSFHNDYPDLEILTMHPCCIPDDDVYGWSIESCFLLTQGVDADGNIRYQPRFQNRNENLKLWYTLFGKRDRFGIPDPAFPDNLVFMKRIDKIAKNPMTSTRSIDEMVSSVIMVFLPSDHIDLVSQATRDLLITENVIPQYDIVCINSKTTSDPKRFIMDAKMTARNNDKKGIVVLSARQCSMGVSIDDCDIVVLMNNTRSYDLLFQMMFRCMTEGGGKKRGFVVDFNPHRVVETIMMDYASSTMRQNPKETVRHLLQEKLLCLNSDQWMPCFGHGPDVFTSFTENLSTLFSSRLSQRLDHLFERMIVKPYLLSSIENHKLLQSLFHNIRRRHPLSPDDSSATKPGIEKKRVELMKNNEKNVDSQNESSFSYILYPLSVLISILTIHNDELDVTKRRIVSSQIGIWCKKTVSENELSQLLRIYEEYIQKDHDMKMLIMLMKRLISDNMRNPEELLAIIEKCMVPLDSERVVFAEITTPKQLRKEMLDAIPYEFWTKRDHRVWDPCCGKGGFVLDIVSRFMDGLRHEIPDPQERYRVIIEECVYFSDINERNVYITKLLLGQDKYAFHAYVGDSLQLDIQEHWGVCGFDAVIANPPYNATNTVGTGNTIWQHFIKKALRDWTLTGYGKYVVMVHPCGWRKPSTSKCRFTGLFDEMVKRNYVIRLSIHGIKDGYKTFKSGTRYDWYILERIPSKGKKTMVRDEHGNEIMMDLEKWDWLPNYAFNEIRDWFACHNHQKCPIIYSRNAYGSDRKHVSKKQDDHFRYPCVHTTTSKNGVRFMYSSVRDRGMFGIPKVIFGQTGYHNGFIDKEGKYGMTEHAMAIPIGEDDDGEQIMTCLRSDRFRHVMNACSWSNFMIDWRVFVYFRSDFYKYL